MKKLLPLALVAGLVHAPAMAADNSGMFYWGAGIGGAYFQLDDASDAIDAAATAANALPGTTANAETQNLQLQLGAQFGYQINSYLAIEGSYRHLGKGGWQFSTQDAGGITDEIAEVSASGLGIGLLAFAPLSRSANLYARIDAVDLRSHSKVTQVNTAAATYTKTSNTIRKIRPAAGIGFQVNFEDCNSFRLEATYVVPEAPTLRQSEWPVIGLSAGWMRAF